MSVAANAVARSSGITGYTGLNGVHCKQCHGGPHDSGWATVVMGEAGPYGPTQTYPVEFKFCANESFRGGFNLRVDGVGGGGYLEVPSDAPSDVKLQGNEIRHWGSNIWSVPLRVIL
jgi:hypothetical protein